MKKFLSFLAVILLALAVVFVVPRAVDLASRVVNTFRNEAVDSVAPEHYYIPNGVTRITKRQFANKDYLKVITIPSSVEVIEESAFEGCDNLTTVLFAEGSKLRVIEAKAFTQCHSLEGINLPEGLVEIGWRAFFDCESIETLSIPSSVTKIHDDMYRENPNLEHAEYGNAYYLGNDENPYLMLVKVIDDTASSVTVHKDTKFIYYAAFFGSHDLETINIPEGVIAIGGNAFYHCENLTSIVFGGSAEQWTAVEKGSSWDYDTGNYTVTYKK